jgi:hypothetical protein
MATTPLTNKHARRYRGVWKVRAGLGSADPKRN